MMVEGMSLRSITRMTGASKNTVAKLLEDAGTAFSEYQDATLRNLTCQRIQCDEIWSFVAAKAKNVEGMKREVENAGDVWTWTAIDADTKLVPCFMVGDRSAATAYFFMKDLASRLNNRVQLTTDGHRAYLSAVEGNFGRGGIDYAMLVKHYGPDPESERRYSPPQCVGVEKDEVFGSPDPKHISTSYVERQNLSMRMGIRRFTRLTNAFSKKFANHVHALAIYFMHYNFVRIHQTLRVTPAMEAGVVSSPWTLTDMMTVLEAWEAKQPQKKRGPKPKNRAEN
jgi:IS1 family transposase